MAAIGAASGIALQTVLAQAATAVPPTVQAAVPAPPAPVPQAPKPTLPVAVPQVNRAVPVTPPVNQVVPAPVTQAPVTKPVPPPPALPPVATPVTPPTVSGQVGLPPAGSGATVTVGTGAGAPSSASINTPVGSAIVTDPGAGIPPGSAGAPAGAAVSLPTGALPGWSSSPYASSALDPAGVAIPGGLSGGASPLSNPGAVAALGIPAGGEAVGGLSAGLSEAAFGTSLSASVNSGSAASADTGQGTPMVCPELVFAPLVAGCETLFNPVTGKVPGLASTGLPILSGLAGLLLIAIGFLLYRRSRPSAGVATAAVAGSGQANSRRSRQLLSAGADPGLVTGRGSRRGRSLAPR